MVTEFKELDVRPILASGDEPFQAIMAAVEALAPGQGLTLLAPFKPQPLFSVMEKKGFAHQVSELEGGDFEVRFLPRGTEVLASEDALAADVWPEPIREFDFSDLDPPQPMVRILSELETMSPGEVLFVVLAREPIFLFPELTKRGHQWVGNYDKSGAAFRMMVKRGSADA
ncbi:DUF2249 domain-containing protein [Rhizobium sp. KVB221]|uniref:DUF2249 domain-containing protein n=1 Tax=Rhizobium setariae TaxID=2801340 RepID=A0A936YN95_9HYPH|nr:DUF2249 domain-containing protein [Rhizobium setariae]MBL0373573.1 DUF2249 domain-containing protein [Rhizobium setariae]